MDKAKPKTVRVLQTQLDPLLPSLQAVPSLIGAASRHSDHVAQTSKMEVQILQRKTKQSEAHRALPP
jgi:antitoxin component HigA of HigAB toxin-antitoxin module